jgi:PKHD-type hydroxylase
MLVHVAALLDRETLTQVRSLVADGPWDDGRATAGTQSARVKNNRQLPEDCAAAVQARALVLPALQANALAFSAALPRRIYPPLFNRYDGATNAFGAHIDNAVRTHRASGAQLRTDLSATLFLSAPVEYEGGELVIDDNFGTQRVKLPAGDMILYPASSRHWVEPVTRGARIAAFFWIESMVREDAQRHLLFDLDVAITSLRQRSGDGAETIRLTGCYHNLLRMWADP